MGVDKKTEEEEEDAVRRKSERKGERERVLISADESEAPAVLLL